MIDTDAQLRTALVIGVGSGLRAVTAKPLERVRVEVAVGQAQRS